MSAKIMRRRSDVPVRKRKQTKQHRTLLPRAAALIASWTGNFFAPRMAQNSQKVQGNHCLHPGAMPMGKQLQHLAHMHLQFAYMPKLPLQGRRMPNVIPMHGKSAPHLLNGRAQNKECYRAPTCVIG